MSRFVIGTLTHSLTHLSSPLFIRRSIWLEWSSHLAHIVCVVLCVRVLLCCLLCRS